MLYDIQLGFRTPHPVDCSAIRRQQVEETLSSSTARGIVIASITGVVNSRSDNSHHKRYHQPQGDCAPHAHPNVLLFPHGAETWRPQSCCLRYVSC